MGRPSCYECRAIYEFDGQEPPCALCRPAVHPMNETAMLLWPYVRGQWRQSFDGASALDILAVGEAVRLCNVPEEDLATVARQLLSIGEIIIAEVRSEKDAEKKIQQ